MTFLIVLVVLALPIWLARRGHSEVKIGLGIICAALLPIAIFLALPGAPSALLVLFAIPFGLIGLIWTLVSVLAALKLERLRK